MLATGRHKDVYREDKGNVPLIFKVMGEPVSVKRKDILGMVTDPVFQDALGIYSNTKLWGMPNANGWANEPIEVLEAITALELEAKAMEHEELENARGNKTGDASSSLRKAGK